MCINKALQKPRILETYLVRFRDSVKPLFPFAPCKCHLSNFTHIPIEYNAITSFFFLSGAYYNSNDPYATATDSLKSTKIIETHRNTLAEGRDAGSLEQ